MGISELLIKANGSIKNKCSLLYGGCSNLLGRWRNDLQSMNLMTRNQWQKLEFEKHKKKQAKRSLIQTLLVKWLICQSQQAF